MREAGIKRSAGIKITANAWNTSKNDISYYILEKSSMWYILIEKMLFFKIVSKTLTIRSTNFEMYLRNHFSVCVFADSSLTLTNWLSNKSGSIRSATLHTTLDDPVGRTVWRADCAYWKWESISWYVNSTIGVNTPNKVHFHPPKFTQSLSSFSIWWKKHKSCEIFHNNAI